MGGWFGGEVKMKATTASNKVEVEAELGNEIKGCKWQRSERWPHIFLYIFVVLKYTLLLLSVSVLVSI